MLHKLSTHIAQQLLVNGVISDDDFELYEFSAFCFLFNLIPLGLSIAIGIALNMFWKSILFIIPYVSIRTFSGGFHFKSAKLCFLVTNMILFFFVNHHEKNDLYRPIYNLFGADIAFLSDSFSFKSNRF